jgi:small subunit ribosomal protein S16
MKKHLLEGVKKGAFDEAEASRRFEEWMKQKEAKIELKRSGLEKSKDDEIMKKLAAEKKINEDRAAKLAKKQAELAAKAEAAAQPEAQDAEPVEDQVAEPPAEAQATESAETQVTEPAVEETNAPVEDKQDQQASEEVKPQE